MMHGQKNIKLGYYSVERFLANEIFNMYVYIHILHTG
jgi:hypothetical protein